MKMKFGKYLLLAMSLCIFASVANAQKRQAQHRTTARKTTKNKTKATVTPTIAVTDTVKPVVTAPPPPPVNDSLPVKKVLKSLRPDEAVETTVLKDRKPLTYE